MSVVSWHWQQHCVSVVHCVFMSLPLPGWHLMLPRAGTLSPGQPPWSSGKRWGESVWTSFCRWCSLLPPVKHQSCVTCHPAGLYWEGDAVVWDAGKWERDGYRAPCACAAAPHISHLGNDQIWLWEREISLLPVNIWDVPDILCKRFNCIILSNIIAYSRIKYRWIFSCINEETFSHSISLKVANTCKIKRSPQRILSINLAIWTTF